MLGYKTIVVGIDFTDLGELALAAAADFAGRMGAERLHLVHVVPMPPSWSVLAAPVDVGPFELAWDRAFKLQEQRLREISVPKLRARLTHEIRLGGAAKELVRAAADAHADLVVVAGQRRSGVERTLFGSVASALLRAAHCPVWVVGADRPGTKPFERVLAAVDASPVAERVLAHATALAAAAKGVVHVFSVHEVRSIIEAAEAAPGSWGRDANLTEVLEGLDAQYRQRIVALVDRARVPEVRVELDVVSGGTPARALLAVASSTHPDLVVLGTSGHGAWKRMFLGSTATKVVTEAPCPALVIPAGD